MSSGCRLAGTLETTAISSREGALHPETWPTRNCSEDQTDEHCSQDDCCHRKDLPRLLLPPLLLSARSLSCYHPNLFFFVSFKMYQLG